MNAIESLGARSVELHIAKSRFDTSSHLARKLRAEVKAGRAKYRPSRSHYETKIFVTVRAGSELLEPLLVLSSVAILRDLTESARDRLCLAGQRTPQAWATVYGLEDRRGKSVRRHFNSLQELEGMIAQTCTHVAQRNAIGCERAADQDPKPIESDDY